jgi:hypothetical protein
VGELDHRGRQNCRDTGIDSVAAALQNAHTGLD